MTSSIRLSAKSARELLRIVESGGHFKGDFVTKRAVDEVRAALTPRPKSAAVRKTERKRKSKTAELKAIRAEVEKRAGGVCENCESQFTPIDPAELDHHHGRVRAKQSVRNCWLICRTCHRNRTNNYPGASTWWERIGDFCAERVGPEEARVAYALADKHAARGIR